MVPPIRGRPFLCVLCDLRVNRLFRSEFYTRRSERSLRPIRFGRPFIRGSSIPLRSLRSLGESSFLTGILHTEIAKIAKTDFGLGDPSIRGSSISLRSLRPLCEFLFLNGVLHTEIAKIAKTDSVWMALRFMVARSFAIFAISVWIVFSDRSFTHRDRKDYRDRIGLGDPSMRGSFIPLRSLRSSV
jgi:hypothetical protein